MGRQRPAQYVLFRARNRVERVTDLYILIPDDFLQQRSCDLYLEI